MMNRIFISYKRVDKEKVFKIKDQIESALGEKCWIDLDCIESDAQFANVIIKAINECEVFLFMYSAAHSQITDYKNDWTVRELDFAQHKKKRIVFVNLDGSPLSDWFYILFGTMQQVDATSEERILRLLQDIRKWLGICYEQSHSHKGEESNPKDKVIGSLIYGDSDIYRVVELIGEGSTSKVYKGYSVKTKIAYAIKRLDIIDLDEYISPSFDTTVVIPRDLVLLHHNFNEDDLDEWKLLMRNSSIVLSNLHHDNLANVVEYIEMPGSNIDNSEGGLYCIMEYIEGENLSDYINNKPLSEQDAALIIRHICEAVRTLHKHGILHLDVKPSNIIYNSKIQKTVLIDYSTSLSYRTLQDIKKIWVTPGYVPFDISYRPFLRKEELCESIDTYSIGATLFSLLTNERPPRGLDSIGYSLSKVNTTPELCRIIEHAMSDDENERYKHVDEFIDDLNALPSLSKTPHYGPLTKEEIECRKNRKTKTLPISNLEKPNI